jgi:hypothetical protein
VERERGRGNQRTRRAKRVAAPHRARGGAGTAGGTGGESARPPTARESVERGVPGSRGGQGTPRSTLTDETRTGPASRRKTGPDLLFCSVGVAGFEPTSSRTIGRAVADGFSGGRRRRVGSWRSSSAWRAAVHRCWHDSCPAGPSLFGSWPRHPETPGIQFTTPADKNRALGLSPNAYAAPQAPKNAQLPPVSSTRSERPWYQ